MPRYDRVNGCDKLRTWRINVAHLTQMQVATYLGLPSATMVSDIENHRRIAHSNELALKIEELTNGAVRAEDWIP